MLVWGNEDQLLFVNVVVVVEIILLVDELLQVMLVLEWGFGCVCDLVVYWGLCVLDLDLLLYGVQVFDQFGLQVFYFYLYECVFVLVLLVEIVFDLVIFGYGSVWDVVVWVDVCGIVLIG